MRSTKDRRRRISGGRCSTCETKPAAASYWKNWPEQATIQINYHVSRHSFADYARQKDVDLYSISKALGHASFKTTETYLKGFDNDAVDDAMDGLFG